jgi:hypothetical protein
MKGRAYVFLRRNGAPLPTGPAGHVGWAIEMEDGQFFAGSTENNSASFIVQPGSDNAAWVQTAADEEAMIDLFRQRGYDGYKVATTRDCKPESAAAIGRKAAGWGYTGLFNNCLDHAYAVIDAYGLPGMPWKQTNPVPSNWFAMFVGEYQNL